MILLITGDRTWKNKTVMVLELGRYPKDSTLIHGNANGADKMSALVALNLGFKQENIISVPADWAKYGRAAGPIRNRLMYDTYKPDITLAFHNDLKNSKGTKDMVAYSLKKGTSVR